MYKALWAGKPATPDCLTAGTGKGLEDLQFDHAGSLDELQRMLATANGGYEVLVFDLPITGQAEFMEVMEMIRSRGPLKTVLVLHCQNDCLRMSHLYRYGVRAVLYSDSTIRDLPNAIRQVINGKLYVHDNFLEHFWDVDLGGGEL